MKLMVIDGNSILNRAFYGIRELTNKDGLFTNGIYGFLTTYFRLISEENPDKTVVCFDVRAKTFRHLEFEDYKGTRKGMPEELAQQVPVLKDVLDALGIDRYELAGFEADDLIGTISQFCNENSHECVIITGDKDSLQLATNTTTINLVSTRMGKTTTKKYNRDTFVEEYGFEPNILTDLKGLMGDTSDNIPGVMGVGEKTAMTLLRAFANIEGIYENIESEIIKKGAREKLKNDKDNAYKSRSLATIVKNVEFDFDINKNTEVDSQKAVELFNMLEFKNFAERFDIKKESKVEILAPKTKIINNLENISGKVYVTGEVDKLVILSNNIANILVNPSNEDFKRLFSSDFKVIMHDAKNIMVKLFEMGIDPGVIEFDTALALYLLEPSRSDYSLANVSEDILGYIPKEINEEISLFGNQNNDEDLAINTAIIKTLHEKFEVELGDMKSLYFDIELPLMTVLASMQSIGIKIDTKELKIYGDKLQIRIDELTKNIYELCDEEFNINSTKQLGDVLFNKLELPVIKKTKTGYSTNADVLDALRGKHDVIEFIIEYRTLSKLHSTYVDGLLKVVKNDGKIHTTFQQMVTTTGRLSSTDPNLQNIPVRTPIGSELRKMFIVSNDDFTLIDADYSQIELRILAHMSQDEVMINAFKQGIDIHTVTASQVFDVAIEDVTKEMRSSAKAVNFGIVYGISEFSLGNDIGVSRAEAKEYMQNYFDKYSGVKNYMENIKKQAYEDFYVTTLFGRKRVLNELRSSNFNMRSFGERVALNTPIQGTAADIIKIAMVNVYNRIKEEKLNSRLILQIHDELIIEAPNEEKDYVSKLLKDEMESAFKGQVELLVEYNFGKNWYEAH